MSSFLPILLVVAIVIIAMYFLLNKKSEASEREGIVKDILNKDALSVDFGDGQAVVVKLHGISVAVEGEMMDEKIYAFYDEHIRGSRVKVVTKVSEPGVLSAQVRTLSGEYVNAVLVRHGFARWSVSEAAADTELAEAQQKAKAEQVGVWNPAIIQLLEDRRATGEASDDDIANMSVDPEAEEETK